MNDELVNECLLPERYCFCELAPLYALDLLTDTERQWVEQQVVDCPELAEELTEYQLAVTAIPYGLEAVPPLSPDLKAKLFDRLDLISSPAQFTPLTTPLDEVPIANFAPFLTIRSAQLHWRPHLVPGVKIAILHTDEVQRERVGVLMAEPGMIYPSHRHGGVEEIYMLSGDLELEGITYYSGDYIRSATGSTHSIARSATGCMFFFHSSMDDEYPD